MYFDNNCNSDTNGEVLFYNNIKNSINVIFDVGTSNSTDYLDFEKEVHYFEPVKHYIEEISKKPTNNKRAFYNNFGLSNEDKEAFYYPGFESFCDRVVSLGRSDESNKILLKLRKAKDYMIENNVDKVDFLKIDTEGYELHVLQGFEELLSKVDIVQFEYGGCYMDSNVKLIEVIQLLESYGFHKFAYLTHWGVYPLTDFADHYNYSNIVCVNKNSSYVPHDLLNI